MTPINFLLPFLLLIRIIFFNSIDAKQMHQMDIDLGSQNNIFLDIGQLVNKCGHGQGLLICYKSELLNNQGIAKASRRFQMVELGAKKFELCKNSSNIPHSGILFNYQDQQLNIETSYGFNFSTAVEGKFGIQLRETHTLLSSLKGCEDKSICEALNKLGEMFNQTMQSASVPYVDDFEGIWHLGLDMIPPKASKITYFLHCPTGILSSEATTTTVNTTSTNSTSTNQTQFHTTTMNTGGSIPTTTTTTAKSTSPPTPTKTTKSTSTPIPATIVTKTTNIHPTTDWPKSTELTEEQKKQKLEECQRDIDEYNQVLGHDMRELDEEECLMNLEEKIQMWHLGGVSEEDNKPIEGGQKCDGEGCEVIVPIPEDTPLNITWDHYTTEETIMVPKRARRQADKNQQELVEGKGDCYYNEFDLRKRAISEICRKKIAEIEDQGDCPSCTFAAIVPAITGRHCMSTLIQRTKRGRIIDICNKNYNALRKDPMHDAIDVICNTTEKDKLSIRDPMECLTGTCQNSSSHEMIWKFHIINSAFRDSCKPYRCCQDQPKPVKCFIDKGNYRARAGRCNKNILFNRLKKFYKLSGTKFMKTIMDEIVRNGPVTASMRVYDNFSGKLRNRIYTVSKNAIDTGGHAVRLIGFGEKKCRSSNNDHIPLYTIKYWIVANSWGKEWNGDGTFRIRRGTNEANIESRMIYGHFYKWHFGINFAQHVEDMFLDPVLPS